MVSTGLAFTQLCANCDRREVLPLVVWSASIDFALLLLLLLLVVVVIVVIIDVAKVVVVVVIVEVLVIAIVCTSSRLFGR